MTQSVTSSMMTMPLTLTSIMNHAQTMYPDNEVVSVLLDGTPR